MAYICGDEMIRHCRKKFKEAEKKFGVDIEYHINLPGFEAVHFNGRDKNQIGSIIYHIRSRRDPGIVDTNNRIYLSRSASPITTSRDIFYNCRYLLEKERRAGVY